ncbi:hypothetical protein [Sphingobacterium pedocola]|uniref:hypothetical protein n=1 Tax=Sphingobacterium pedocola TaxID=2082722 RepID=UPI001E4E476B|nr:hypothetical protein [Sphingobacterium pedocola]
MTKVLTYKVLYATLFVLTALVTVRCAKDEFPVDEDGLLITSRTSAYVGSFDLWSPTHQTVVVGTAAVDTVAQTINLQVQFGTDLTRLWPRFSLITDAKLEPKITGFVDFSDLENPKQWTVISGNRQVRKVYTVHVTVQQP